MLNNQLIAELPQLLDLRVPYFDPSFEAMIRMQAKFAEEGYEKLSGVQRYVDVFKRRALPSSSISPDISLTLCATITLPASWMLKWKVSLQRCANYRYVEATDFHFHFIFHGLYRSARVRQESFETGSQEVLGDAGYD